ncbi:MAG: hypothetical protein MJZ90_06130 [Bacteroidales bacterium]|nr:hypothetical protein [Bacteroidales bacterium]
MIRISDIPKGNSRDDIKAREKVIDTVFREWHKEHPSGKVYNADLKDYIKVIHISLVEAIEHSAKSYLSTLAAIQIDVVLRSAVCVGKPGPIKQNDANQRKFIKMQVMKCKLVGIGKVKLTVGIRKSKEKIQYCITAIRT